MRGEIPRINESQGRKERLSWKALHIPYRARANSEFQAASCSEGLWGDRNRTKLGDFLSSIECSDGRV